MSTETRFNDFIQFIQATIELDQENIDLLHSAIDQIYGTERPKNKVTGWKAFLKNRMEKMKKEGIKMSGADKMKIVSEEWKSIEPQVKHEQWGANIKNKKNKDNTTKNVDKLAPKRTAGWTLYYREQNAILVDKIKEGAERKKIIATSWKKLGKEGKNEWNEKANY